jgi:hypothetical protein
MRDSKTFLQRSFKKRDKLGSFIIATYQTSSSKGITFNFLVSNDNPLCN